MAEALDSTFQDYGPVRFPLAQGHPLLQDEDALEAALLQDALEGVERAIPVDVVPETQQHPMATQGLPMVSGLWEGVSGVVGGAAAGVFDRLSSLVSGTTAFAVPSWGSAHDESHVRESLAPDSEEHVQLGQQSPIQRTEHSMSFSDAPKVIGDPATRIVSEQVHQHYADTCAIQCQRLILNQYGVGVNEEDLVQEASARGIYNHGTSPEDVGKLLESHGVGIHRYENANVFNLSNELAQGHKVIVGVESDDLWHKNSILHEIADFFGLGKADHAVIVSGIDTSDPAHIKVNITDPGTGDVAKSYPIEQFMDAWKGSHFMMISTAEAAPNTLAEMANFPYDQGHIPTVGHAPFELAQGLSETVDPHVGQEAFHQVESEYFSAVHGLPVDTSHFIEVGPFLGQERVAGLFHDLQDVQHPTDLAHHPTDLGFSGGYPDSIHPVAANPAHPGFVDQDAWFAHPGGVHELNDLDPSHPGHGQTPSYPDHGNDDFRHHA